MKSFTSPYALLVYTTFFWSLNWVIGRALVGAVSPMALALVRWIIATTLLIFIARKDIIAHWPAIKAHKRSIIFLGFWGTGLHNAFSYLGLQYTNATNGVILNSAIPIMIIGLGWLLFRDRVTRLQLIGVLISLTGVLLMLCRGDFYALAKFQFNIGDLILLGSMVFWAVYTLYLRDKPAGIPPLALIACCGAVGVLLLIPLTALEFMWPGSQATIKFTPTTIAAMFYVGIFPSALGYIFWNRAVEKVGSNVAGLFVHLMPAFGSALAWIFLNESFEKYHAGGIFLIVAGVVMSSRFAAPAGDTKR